MNCRKKTKDFYTNIEVRTIYDNQQYFKYIGRTVLDTKYGRLVSVQNRSDNFYLSL